MVSSAVNDDVTEAKPVEDIPQVEATVESVEAAEPAAPAEPKYANLDDPELYLNRELTWIEFNHRVLYEAQNEQTPLLERF